MVKRQWNPIDTSTMLKIYIMVLLWSDLPGGVCVIGWYHEQMVEWS